MADNIPGFTPTAVAIPPYTMVGGPENIKLLFDEELDNRREVTARQRAWEAISLDMAQTSSRRAQNAASLDTIVLAGLALHGQVGVSQGQVGVPMTQAPVGPIRTAAGDNLAAGAAPINRVIDYTGATAAGAEQVAAASVATAVAQLAQSLVPVILATGGVVSAEALAALLSQVVAAAGKAAGTAGKTA